LLRGYAGSGADLFAYGRLLEPSWVEVTRPSFALAGLAAPFDGYRIAQISDIHLDGDWMTRERLADLVGTVNGLAPDLIAITGDFVSGGPLDRFLPILRDGLARLRTPDGVVAVLGNHDHWTDPERVGGMLRDIGITELRNTAIGIERGGATLQIAGVDDHWVGADRLDLVLERLTPNVPAILLAHEPDFADISAATGRFALQLSGHSHGGQISLPVLGPPLLPFLGQRYPRGRYRVGGMAQYTNRGVGMIRPYGRLNCRPEITLVGLRAIMGG
jgi:predicted MPP superfamily phosphohydrolase